MSAFKDQLAADLESVFYNDDDFAEAISYTPYGGTAKNVKALVDYGEGEQYQGSGAYDVRAALFVRVADLAAVTNKDTVVIDGQTWGVVGAEKINDGLEWRIELNRDT